MEEGSMKKQRKNLFTKVATSLLFCVVIVFWGYQVYGEEWTDAQKDVWKNVVSYWEYCKQGDAETISANYYAEDSFEWWYDKAVPLGKKAVIPLLKEWFLYDKPSSYELEPVNIHIVDNVAIVFYLWKYQGNILSNSGRNLDTYIKKDNKWKFIGGMNSSCEKPLMCK
jgi:hypothetical protein